VFFLNVADIGRATIQNLLFISGIGIIEENRDIGVEFWLAGYALV
jgi:hypothetical protein